jgi:hypothetical protein
MHNNFIPREQLADVSNLTVPSLVAVVSGQAQGQAGLGLAGNLASGPAATLVPSDSSNQLHQGEASSRLGNR